MAATDTALCPWCADALGAPSVEDLSPGDEAAADAARAIPAGSMRSLYHPWCWREFRVLGDD